MRLSHEGGIETGYAHCHDLQVRQHETVSQGQVIATVGSTGLAQGPHLHFELWAPDGITGSLIRVDPLVYLRDGRELVTVTYDRRAVLDALGGIWAWAQVQRKIRRKWDCTNAADNIEAQVVAVKQALGIEELV